MVCKLIVRVALCWPFIASCSAPLSSDPHFAVGRGPGCVTIHDLNGDGKQDLIVANERGGDVSVLLGDGKGGLSAARGSPFTAGHSPNDLAVGDFNQDGFPDFAVAN